MSLIKTSITIPDDIYNKAKETSDNFSALVAEALKEYFRKEKIRKAVASFGSWEQRDKDSVEIVNELRNEEGRNYAKRSN